jgi:hypothetical protein
VQIYWGFWLRHQLLILQRQVGKPAFTDADRAARPGDDGPT